MARDKEFHDYIVFDVLGDIPGIFSKLMFGGYGIFLNRKMFGLISDSEFYIKINKEDIDAFKEMGSRQFSYEREGKEVKLGYWLVSEDILDDREVVERQIFKCVKK